LKVWQASVTDSAFGLFHNDIQDINEVIRKCFARTDEKFHLCLNTGQACMLTAVFTNFIDEYFPYCEGFNDNAACDLSRDALIDQMKKTSRCNKETNSTVTCKNYITQHIDYKDILTLDTVSNELRCSGIILSLMIHWDNLQRLDENAHDSDYIYALHSLFCRYPAEGFLFFFQLYLAYIRKDEQLLLSLENQINIMYDFVNEQGNSNPQYSPHQCFERFRTTSINKRKFKDIFGAVDPFSKILNFSLYPAQSDKWDSNYAKDTLLRRYEMFVSHLNKIDPIIRKNIDAYKANDKAMINESEEEVKKYFNEHKSFYQMFIDLGDDVYWLS
jgi:hypothetical protein